jgi:hypothetical protein
MRALLPLTALLLAVASPLTAQRTWLVPLPDRGASLEIATGLYDRDVTNGFTATIIPGVRLPIGGGIILTGELPISQASVRPGFIGANRSATFIGNPWLGVEMPLRSAGRLELGVRPGLRRADDPAEAAAVGFGVITEYDRFEAWLGKTTSVRGVVHLGRLPAEGAFVTARVGGSLLIPDGTGADPELFLNYGVRAGMVRSGTMFFAAVTGRGLLTGAGAPLDDLTVHQVGLGLESLRGQVRPQLGARIFLDAELENVNAVLTAGFSWGW